MALLKLRQRRARRVLCRPIDGFLIGAVVSIAALMLRGRTAASRDHVMGAPVNTSPRSSTASICRSPIRVSSSPLSSGKALRGDIAVYSISLGNFQAVTYERPPPTTTYLASRIEKSLESILDGEANTRVVDSWRYLSLDYEHKAYVGTDPTKTAETSNCHQQAHSYVPDLTVQPYWDVQGAEWRQKLEANWEEIRDEFVQVISDPEYLQANAANVWVGGQSDTAREYGAGWKTLGLLDRGVWDPVNSHVFPKTAKIIHDSGIPAVEAFFASMEANSAIQLHTDNANFVLTTHLPLIVPENGKNKCRITVGDDTQQWLEGKVIIKYMEVLDFTESSCLASQYNIGFGYDINFGLFASDTSLLRLCHTMMMFDTSILHDAVNESNEKRYILMFRVWHPDLSEKERNALQFALDALSVPELISESPEERKMAAKQVATMRTFPDLRKLKPKKLPTPVKKWRAKIGGDNEEGDEFGNPSTDKLALEDMKLRKKSKKKNRKQSNGKGMGGGFGG
eukprot:jgi/Bigna1/76108/fgenesh1_pg.39_\